MSRRKATAKGREPEGFDDFVSVHEELFARCESWVERLETVYPQADAMVTLRRSMSLAVDGEESRCLCPPAPSVLALRVFDGTGWIEACSDRLDVATGDALVEELLAAPRLRPSAVELPRLAPARWHRAVSTELPVAAVPVERKLAMLVEWTRILESMDPGVVRAEAGWVEEDVHQHFVARDRVLSQRIPSLELSMAAYLREGPAVENGRWGNRWVGGLEILEGVDPEHEARRLVTRARSMFTAEPVPAGRHVLVTAPEVSGTIAHEAFGHGVEADSVACGCSRADRFLGREVASKIVTLVDHPQGSNTSGHYFFDDEGVEATRTVILDRGVLVAGISDRLAAARLGWKPSGNGRRSGPGNRIFSRMSNTFIEAGSSTPAELVGRVDRGIFLSGESGGQEDPLGWGIQVNVRRGEEIRDGRLTGRVFRCPVLTGHVPDVLRSIAAVGNDLAGSGKGKCGKTFRKDWIPVTIASPSLLLEGRLA